ncbi:MAG: hypothetical protein ACI8XO_003659 [Verrucomicrobiales bacterium]
MSYFLIYCLAGVLVILFYALLLGDRGGENALLLFLAGVDFFHFPLALIMLTFWPITLVFVELERRTEQEKLHIEQERLARLPPPPPDEMIGQQGKTITTLALGGRVRIVGKDYDAMADGLPIEKGEAIEVIGKELGELLVSKNA